jgi:hypothetical protein
MTSYTPGPWEVAHGGSYNRGEMVSEEWFVRRPDDDVAIAADIIDPYDSKPSEANARLIAHAPELVEALEAALGWMDALKVGGIVPVGRRALVELKMKEIGAVLAAARGER